ncbi:MAG: hypothetical protein KIT20_16020 [Alphaproteobacteria bacterium]|nr:hypothetical protein [Alphaproteobacteria bacterium]
MREIAPSSAIRSPGPRAQQPAASAAPSPVVASQPAATQDGAVTLSASLLRLAGLGELAATVIAGEDGRLLLELADGRLFRTDDTGLRLGQRLLLAITGTLDDLVRALVIALDDERVGAARELLLKAEPGARPADRPALGSRPPTALPDTLSALLLQPVNAGDRRAPLLLPAGTEIRLRPVPLAELAGAPLPGEAAVPSEPLGPGMRLTVVPIQARTGDRWIYRTALGNIALSLPPGVTFAPALEVEVMEILPPAGAERPAGSLGGIRGHALEAWPDFTEALSVGAAAEPLREMTPRLAPRGIERLFVFLAGLRRGEIGRLIEDQIEPAMRIQGKENAARRLGEDLREMQRLEREQAGSEWRALALPLAGHDRVLPVWFFHRGFARQGRDGSERGSRFVIELRLSELGPVQIDGFVREKMFDLFLRTHRPLPAAMRSDIETIFHRGLEEAGLGGALAFQTVTPFPVTPLESLAPRRAGGSIAI